MNKKHVYKRRLLKLADFLDILPRKRFNYNKWVGSDWKGKQDLSCGTTGCALGWAATLPSLRKAGLTLKRTDDDDPIGYVSLRESTDDVGNVEDAISSGIQASNKVFGLSNGEFEYLFIPDSGWLRSDSYDKIKSMPAALPGRATPKQVAKRIRRFVKHKYG